MRGISVIAGVFSLSAIAMAQTTYKITEQGSTGCAVFGMNDISGIAGQCNATATVWENGVARDLGKLPKGTYSAAQSINSSGAAVGNGDAGDGRPHATLYRNGAVLDIEPSASNAYAIRINDPGVIAGNVLKGFDGCSNWSVAIWVEDSSKPGRFRRTDLQPYPGGDANARCEYALAANQSVQVVGWVQNSLFGQRGAFWNNDSKHTLSLLQPFPGDWTSIAWGVNDLGQAVGESHPPFSSRPVLWNNDTAHTPTELPVLPGDNYGAAIAVNNAGQVVGTSAYAVPGTWNVGPSRFVIWRDGGVFNLQSLLDPASGAGWTITGISAINNLGQIAGTATHNGQSTAFVMTPMFR
jgi:uncharacterized membrane protein